MYSAARSMVDTASEREARLQERFGLSAFRPWQREAIEALLDARPRAAGRADRRRQEPDLPAAGDVAAGDGDRRLAADRTDGGPGRRPRQLAASRRPTSPRPWARAEFRERLGAHRATARYDLVYVAPERLIFPGFRPMLRGARSRPLSPSTRPTASAQWGHDFRPEYLRIGELLEALPRRAGARLHGHGDALRARRDPRAPGAGRLTRRRSCAASRGPTSPCAAAESTAAATSATAWSTPCCARGAGAAPRSTAARHRLRPDPQQHRGGGAIACAARGWRCGAYHAGLARRAARPRAAALRRAASSTSSSRPTPSAWASTAPTCARSSTWRRRDRSRPTTRRSAARDATASRACGLLLSRRGPGPAPPAHRARRPRRRAAARRRCIEHKWSLFLELMRWAEGGSCRHDAILRYFGDEEETLAGCGRCDVCERLGARAASSAR